MFETCAGLPDGVGLATQVQASPPPERCIAPRGTTPLTQFTTAPLAWNELLAKARRPSGHSISTSVHCTPLFSGEKVYVSPNAGSWSRASQTIRAPARLRAGALSESVSGCSSGTTMVGTVIAAVAEFHAPL